MIRSSSICATFIYNYISSEKESDENGDAFTEKCKKLRCLSKTLESYGGVLSKMSQLLSLNNQNSKVFSECKPFSKEKTTLYFKNNCPKNVKNIDYNVFKSGSVGQVYKATYKKKKIILKVQYVGLAEQTVKDLQMLNIVSTYLYSFADIKNAMIEIKNKMNEELDYKLEATNQKIMYNLWKNSDYVEIPKVIQKLSTNMILVMNFVNGKSMYEFIENSTQDERNKFGMCVFKFVFENIYKNNILYSDIHYGNFLVKDDYTLSVIDFGCLHKIDKELVDSLIKLHKCILEKNKDSFYDIVESIGIIKKDISHKSKQYLYDYFIIQYTPLISEDFEFTEEWLSQSLYKDIELMKEWIIPDNMVYFNKIPFGAYHVFTKLKLKGNFKEIFDKMFEN